VTTAALDGKVALVTGGGRNIGRQICLTLAEHGCDVVVNVRSNLAEATAVAEEIVALGRRAIPVAADVGDAAAVDAMVERIKAEFGRVDVLVNNAVILRHVRFLEMTEERWQELLAVVLSGPVHTCRAVLPMMMEQGTGSIINISGTVVFYGTWPHLAAAKAGIHGLTRGLAREFGPHGIRVNIIVPSTIETVVPVPRDPDRLAAEIARTPLGRVGTTREVADVCAFLASDMSSFVTGQTIHLNGGQHMP
jgi:3-oxoacyl-[acyl-carrier protein] reductase